MAELDPRLEALHAGTPESLGGYWAARAALAADARPPAAGDVYHFPVGAEIDVRWVVAEVEPDAVRFVPVDGHPLVGPADVVLTGGTIARCGFACWAGAERVAGGSRTEVLPSSPAAIVRRIGEIKRGVDDPGDRDDPAYREWLEAVERSVRALAECLGGRYWVWSDEREVDNSGLVGLEGGGPPRIGPPSLAPFAGLLADLAADLRRTECCLVVCDKGWTLPLYAALKERLRAANVKSGYLDGRGSDGATGDGGVMLSTVAMMRYVARAETEGVVYALPHLDVMTTTEGGWTTISREVIPLLYENPLTVWLGFQDPSLPLPDVVTKVFTRRYVITEKYRTLVTVPPPPSPPG